MKRFLKFAFASMLGVVMLSGLVACSNSAKSASSHSSSSSSKASQSSSSASKASSSSSAKPSSSSTASQSSASTAPVATGMNLQEIAQGDFSSVQGTWENSNGDTLIFSGSNITYALSGQKFSAALINSKYEYEIGNTLLNSQGDMELFFAPKGISPAVTADFEPFTDNTDISKDRICLTSQYGSNGDVFAFEYGGARQAYYKVN